MTPEQKDSFMTFMFQMTLLGLCIYMIASTINDICMYFT